MPFILIAVGIILVVTGFKNTQTELGQQLVSDFTGAGNFVYWIVAIFAVGALGYIDALRAPSRMLLALIIVALLFSNKGFFAQFLQQIKAGTAKAPQSGPAVPSNSGSGGSGGITTGSSSGSGIDTQTVAEGAALAAMMA